MAIVKESHLRGTLCRSTTNSRQSARNYFCKLFRDQRSVQQKYSRSSKGEPHCSKRRSFPAGWWRAAHAQQVIIPGPRICRSLLSY